MAPSEELPPITASPSAEERLLPAAGSVPRRVASTALIVALILLGLWIMKPFLVSFIWAAILAVTTWPVYERVALAFSTPRQARYFAPAIATLAIGLVFLVPLTFGAIEFGREAIIAAHNLVEAEQRGIPVPSWVEGLPLVGQSAAAWWRANLADPHSAYELLGHLDRTSLLGLTGALGKQIAGRAVDLIVTLFTLFFLYRDGDHVAHGLVLLADRTVGPAGKRIGAHMIAAVRSTVNGLVVVGLGEGVVLGIAYAAFGIPEFVLLGTLTGVFAAIPFGAGLVFTGCSLALLVQGKVTAAIALFVTGTVVVSIADHFVRPIVISGAIRLPFFWVLLGIVGGLESFGLIGLFLGPAIVASLISLWRELEAPPEPPYPEP